MFVFAKATCHVFTKAQCLVFTRKHNVLCLQKHNVLLLQKHNVLFLPKHNVLVLEKQHILVLQKQNTKCADSIAQKDHSALEKSPGHGNTRILDFRVKWRFWQEYFSFPRHMGQVIFQGPYFWKIKKSNGFTFWEIQVMAGSAMKVGELILWGIEDTP